MNKNYNNIIAFLSIILLIGLSTVNSIYAKKTGVSGKTSATSQGCNCHGNAFAKETNLTPMSKINTFTVKAGSTNMFSVSVYHPSLTQAGINISVKTTTTGETNAGTLGVISGEGLQLVGSELTHSSPKSMTAGSATFIFNWTAPATPGKYYLRAIGNAVNGNNRGDSDDKWNWMAPQEITVEDGNSVEDLDIRNSIYPNPFKESANINLSNFVDLQVRKISVFDASGNELRTFDNSKLVFSWDGRNSSGEKVYSGIYYLVIKLDNGQRVLPIVSF